MNITRKYWTSVYIYILLMIPTLCMCAGAFWTIFKLMGHYNSLPWSKILVFDFSQVFYLSLSLYCIFKNKKDETFIHRNLSYIKCFVLFALFIQYNFILYLFPSTYVWACTFLFFAVVVFFFDTRMTVINLLSYQVSLLVAHVRNTELFLPMDAENLMEIIAFRIVIIELTTLSIIVIVYFAEHFVMEARERDEENIKLVEKQLEYYKDMELLDTEIRKFRHDINNHFACMGYLLENGQIKELQNYFGDLKEFNTVQKRIYLSGNEIIDAVLHYDLQRVCDERVMVKIQGNLCSIETVSSMDLCTVFSNLLSNAIKSANKCVEKGFASSDEASYINIVFSYGKKYFSIEINNTFCQDAFSRSTEIDKNHGFGLNKIREVVEKYSGKLEWDIEQNMVSMMVYLPI